MAQRHTQTIEKKVESAFSDVGAVVDQTHHVQSVAEAVYAEARSVRVELLPKIA